MTTDPRDKTFVSLFVSAARIGLSLIRMMILTFSIEISRYLSVFKEKIFTQSSSFMEKSQISREVLMGETFAGEAFAK